MFQRNNADKIKGNKNKNMAVLNDRWFIKIFMVFLIILVAQDSYVTGIIAIQLFLHIRMVV